MSTSSPSAGRPADPRIRPAFLAMRLLSGCYLAVSLLTLAAVVALRRHHSLVNDAVWVRGTIVAASAFLTFAFAVRAARGSRRAYQRLRVISVVMVVAVATIVALPGLLPLWMKIEQGACGLLLVALVVLTNRRHLRSSFARAERVPVRE